MTTITKQDISEVFNESYDKVIEPRFHRIDKKLENQDKEFNDLPTHFDQICNKKCHAELDYWRQDGQPDL